MTESIYKCIVFDYYGTLFNPLRQSASISKAIFFDGVQDLLKDLNNKQVLCALATRTPIDVVKAQLQSAGLINYFACIKSTELGYDKPDPTVLNEILLELGVIPKDALMVGDSISDLAFGHNAGVDSMFVNFNEYNIDSNMLAEINKYTNFPIMKDITQLTDFLRR